MGRPKGTKFQRALSLRLESDMWDVLERMAVEEERPIGMMARIILREGLEAREAMESRRGKGSLTNKRRGNGKTEGPG
jgi:hypothetical protein